MGRTVAFDTLEAKIEKAQEKVIKRKEAYDEAVDELQVLLDKITAIRTDEIMKAIAKSSKSYEEILSFINA